MSDCPTPRLEFDDGHLVAATALHHNAVGVIQWTVEFHSTFPPWSLERPDEQTVEMVVGGRSGYSTERVRLLNLNGDYHIVTLAAKEHHLTLGLFPRSLIECPTLLAEGQRRDDAA